MYLQYNDEAVHYVAESSQSVNVGSSDVKRFHVLSYPSLSCTYRSFFLIDWEFAI
jgi:hypothetical protein